MREFLAEIDLPGVEMRVELHQADRPAEPPCERAQQRQGDAMLAAETDQMTDACRLLFDARQAGLDIAERDRELANVGNIHRGRVDPASRMLAVHQHPAGGAYGARSGPGAGAVGSAEIERHAGNAEPSIPVGAGDAHKA